MLGAILLVAAPSAHAANEGKVNFLRHVQSADDWLITSSTPAQRTWMRSHYWRMRGYPPFFDQALSWAPPSHFYQDIYAIYRDDPADQQLIQDHPDWVLRDAQGNKLYIQFDCSGGSCPQYAADIGNPGWRQYWIAKAQDVLDAPGSPDYAGIFIDDVNLEMKVSDGSGTFTRPIDPRTGQPMTDSDWRRYMAEFTEQIEAAFPSSVEITHNALWWMDPNDPYVQREIDAADYVEMERGFNDTNIVGGSGTYGYQTYLTHVDWLHSRGAGVTFEPSGLNAQSAMFELASYLLVSNGKDSIATNYQANPDNWWTGWETSLGDAILWRYDWQGVTRRDFAGGMALVNEPGASTKTLQLPGRAQWTNLNGQQVSSVTLGPREGVVLHGVLSQSAARDDTIGIFRGGAEGWYLKDSNTQGLHDFQIPHFGYAGGTDESGDRPVVGDWDGDGIDTPGIFRGDAAGWSLMDESGAVTHIEYGYSSDRPVAGDWDGDGIDTIGVYRRSNGTWYLRSEEGTVTTIPWGCNCGERPIVGDWDGNGTDYVGLYWGDATGWWLINDTGSYVNIPNFGYSTGDKPIVGDWDGDGDDTIGIFRGGAEGWYLKNRNDQSTHDIQITNFGYSGDKPVAGNWGRP